MPKDGEGKHAIWEQLFELANPAKVEQKELILEGHEGSPFESKFIAKTKSFSLDNVDQNGELKVEELRLFNEEDEDIGYVNISTQLAAAASQAGQSKAPSGADQASDITKKVTETMEMGSE